MATREILWIQFLGLHDGLGMLGEGKMDVKE